MQTFDQSIFGLFEQGLVTLRRSAALGVERRRVQAEGPGHLDHRRHGARPDGQRGRRRPATPRNHAVRRLDAAPSSRRRTMPTRLRRRRSTMLGRARAVRGAGPRSGCSPRKVTTPTTIDAAVARLRGRTRARRSPRGAARSRAPRAALKQRGRARVPPQLERARHRPRHRRARRSSEVFGDVDDERAARRGARPTAAARRDARRATGRASGASVAYLVRQGFDADASSARCCAARPTA